MVRLAIAIVWKRVITVILNGFVSGPYGDDGEVSMFLIPWPDGLVHVPLVCLLERVSLWAKALLETPRTLTTSCPHSSRASFQMAWCQLLERAQGAAPEVALPLSTVRREHVDPVVSRLVSSCLKEQ